MFWFVSQNIAIFAILCNLFSQYLSWNVVKAFSSFYFQRKTSGGTAASLHLQRFGTLTQDLVRKKNDCHAFITDKQPVVMTYIAIFGCDTINISVAHWHWVVLEERFGCFCRDYTLVLLRGASGLRTGPLFCFPEELLRGTDFLLDVILSRMFDIRCWLDEDAPWTWITLKKERKSCSCLTKK